MAKSKSAAAAPKAKKQKKTVVEPTGRYINPLTDFGFKYIFGTKEYLIDFLNAVLKMKEGIVDLQYDNTERPGRSEDDRSTIFDLYCTLGNGERVLIEMQTHPQGYFKKRILYYASRMIQEQGEGNKGDEWGFALKRVYSINIVNFPLDPKENKTVGKYASYVQLMDKNTRRIFSDTLTFVFLELPHFYKGEHELSNSIEEWMFVLKNLAWLNDLPNALRTRVFERLFRKAEIAKLSKEKRKEYDQSVKNLLDMNALITEKNSLITEKNSLIAEKNSLIVEKDRKISALTQNNAALTQNNAALQNEVAELRRRLGKMNAPEKPARATKLRAKTKVTADSW